MKEIILVHISPVLRAKHIVLKKGKITFKLKKKMSIKLIRELLSSCRRGYPDEPCVQDKKYQELKIK